MGDGIAAVCVMLGLLVFGISHSVRGALSGALKKKRGLTIESLKIEDRGRVYKLAD